jgi:large repetitive protein
MISLKQQRETQQQLSALCGAAIQQQIKRGNAQLSQLRQRRRLLLKALRKRLPKTALHSAEKILHSAMMVLTLWGFTTVAMPNTAQAAAVFEHVMLEGFDMGFRPKPVLVDIDNDGDLDAFVGENNGTVKFYRNYSIEDGGTASAPRFAADVAGNPLAGFDVGSSAAPAFADIDNDGDLDLFVGEVGGSVKFYQNNGTANAPNFVAADGATVINPMAAFMVSAGNTANPTLVDIDGDGDLDLFGGEVNGTVQFFQNNGTAYAPSFVAADGVTVINPLASINFPWSNGANPTFADIDNDGDFDAFVGNGSYAKFYRNNGTAIAPAFTADAAGNPLAATYLDKAAPTFADIDNDGDLDAFIGSQSGTVAFFRNDGTAAAPVFVSGQNGATAEVDTSWYSKPGFADIDNDGDLDLFVGESNGTVKFYRNTGTTAAPIFAADAVGNPLAGFDVGSSAAPAFADIDGDGDLDAFVGEYYGAVKFYRNTGTAAAPAFAADAAGNPLTGFDVGYYSAPVFADIDNDGDLDAFVGVNNGTVKFYRNNGTAAAPAFAADTAGNPLAGFDVGTYASPTFADIDYDGDLDAFVGNGISTMQFFRNTGTAAAPNFVAADGVTVINPLEGFATGYRSTPTFIDIDNDGDPDLFVGNSLGTVYFFENLDPTPGVAAGGGSSAGGGGGCVINPESKFDPVLPLIALITSLTALIRRKERT